MAVVAIDFETYYDKDYSVSTMGYDQYCRDPKFDPYMVAVFSKELGIDWVGHPQDFNWCSISNETWISHNAEFDETVYKYAVNRGIIKIKTEPEDWYCTADLAVYLSAPRSLAGACKALFGHEMKKTIRDNMKGKRFSELSDDEQQEWLKYAADDAKWCYEIWDKHSDEWPVTECKISTINRYAGRRGIRVDRPKLKEAINHLQTLRWQAEKNIPWEWDKTPLAPTKLKLACREEGIPCPKSLAIDDKECQEWEHTYGDRYPWISAMRDWRRINILLKRLETVESRLIEGDIFPYSIKYFGSHTGRFSGGGGFNVQNMPRGELFGVDLRSLFIPRPGKVFYIADLAQIEARVTLALAGDKATLDKVREGMSVYEAHAVATMGYEPDPEKPLKKVNPDMYALAKARVLGLGFGCGPARFVELARTMFGMDLSLEEARKTVADFRNSNPKIVNLWNSLNSGVNWSARQDFEVELPSGRILKYYNIRTYPEVSGEVVRTEKRVKLYGGKLAENLVQATARDIFVEALLRIDKDPDVDLVFHVHDEVILEGDPGLPEDKILSLIAVTPDWLKSCPVEAEMVVANKYLK